MNEVRTPELEVSDAGVTRRNFLKAGWIGAASLSLASLLSDERSYAAEQEVDRDAQLTGLLQDAKYPPEMVEWLVQSPSIAGDSKRKMPHILDLCDRIAKRFQKYEDTGMQRYLRQAAREGNDDLAQIHARMSPIPAFLMQYMKSIRIGREYNKTWLQNIDRKNPYGLRVPCGEPTMASFMDYSRMNLGIPFQQPEELTSAMHERIHSQDSKVCINYKNQQFVDALCDMCNKSNIALQKIGSQLIQIEGATFHIEIGIKLLPLAENGMRGKYSVAPDGMSIAFAGDTIPLNCNGFLIQKNPNPPDTTHSACYYDAMGNICTLLVHPLPVLNSKTQEPIKGYQQAKTILSKKELDALWLPCSHKLDIMKMSGDILYIQRQGVPMPKDIAQRLRMYSHRHQK